MNGKGYKYSKNNPIWALVFSSEVVAISKQLVLLAEHIENETVLITLSFYW